MKPLFCTLIIIFLLTTGAFAQQPHTIYFRDGHKAMEGRWRYDNNAYLPISIIQLLLVDNGRNEESDYGMMSYRNNEMGDAMIALHCEGLVTSWYSSGSKKSEITFVDGSATGPYKRYYTSGAIALQGTLLNGMPDGLWRQNYPNGQPYFTGTYRARTQAELEKKWQYLASSPHNRHGEDDEDTDERDEYRELHGDNDTLKATSEYRSLFRPLHSTTHTTSVRNGAFVAYNITGAKIATFHYSEGIRTGLWTYWKDSTGPYVVVEYSAGNVVAVTEKNGRRYPIDKYIKKWKKEMLRTETIQQQSSHTFGAGIVEAPAQSSVFRYVEQMPEFPGNINDYVSKHLIYPKKALKDSVEGRVVVQFVVKEDGTIDNIEVVRRLTPELDKEAIRLVSAMPRWKPGRQNGKAVAVYFTLPVTFRFL